MNALLPAQRRPVGGFTLVELLTVVAIIAILAGLILSTSGYIQKKAARSRAEAEIAAMEAALESYKADNGIYPDTDAVKNPGALFEALTGSSTANPDNFGSNGKIYMELKPGSQFDEGGTAEVLDPWGTAYKFKSDPDGSADGSESATVLNNPATFDLWSTAGTDTTTKDDITNW